MNRAQRGILGLALLAAVAGCDGNFAGVGEIGDLSRARARWQASGLTDYDFTFQRACFCEFRGPVLVTVRQGVVQSATIIATGEALTATELERVPTVDGLFEIAAHAATAADRVSVRYDPVLGYPTLIDVDWIANAVDDEESLLASGVVARGA